MMKAVSTSAVWLLWVFSGIALAGDPMQLPELYLFHYQPAKRDPFISANAARTLVSGEPRVEGVVSGRILEQYLQTLSRLIQKELFVEGVSISDDQAKAVALINGVEFRMGDSLPVPAQPEQISQLEALSRTYGLPLRRGGQPSDSVLFEVGQIKATGVCIVLPGFKTTLCEIPFEGDNIPNQVQLERRRSSSNNR
ncbi:MAG: hypothetical protein JO015_20720 [Verrucomicrobia bacterium]|nr:hypothetical protein [Verrucomicrobiota bacterium]